MKYWRLVWKTVTLPIITIIMEKPKEFSFVGMGRAKIIRTEIGSV